MRQPDTVYNTAFLFLRGLNARNIRELRQIIWLCLFGTTERVSTVINGQNFIIFYRFLVTFSNTNVLARSFLFLDLMHIYYNYIVTRIKVTTIRPSLCFRIVVDFSSYLIVELKCGSLIKSCICKCETKL